MAEAAGADSEIWLPQLGALLAKAPAGSNPFAWYLSLYAYQLSAAQANWAKPIFLLITVVSLLNVPAAVVALCLKRRQDGGLRLYSLRDHISGSRYICLNSTTIFLIGHILTSLTFGIYCPLHLYYYNRLGRAHQDLGWATMMWLAPYIAVLLTSLGVIYGILVAPTPLAKFRNEHNMPAVPPSPLAGLPCWLLNTFVFLAPVLILASIIVPAVILVTAVQESEELAINIAIQVRQWAKMYDVGNIPTIAEQAAFLASLSSWMQVDERARSRWRPMYGLWSAWVALACIISSIAFVVVNRVTKARLIFAKRYAGTTSAASDQDQEHLDADGKRHGATDSGDQEDSLYIQQARSDHISLSLQFSMASLLMGISEIMLLWVTIRGYDVHTNPNLLATALIVPPLAYLLQSTIALGLMIKRTRRAPRQTISPHRARWSSEDRGSMNKSMGGETMSGNGTPKADGYHKRQSSFKHMRQGRMTESGSVTVGLSGVPMHGVAPSYAHRVEIDRVVETVTDEISLAELGLKDEIASHGYKLSLLPIKGQVHSRESDYGRAL